MNEFAVNLAAQLALSPFGYIVAGMLVSIAGVAIIVIAAGRPIVGVIGGVIGFSLIVLGGMTMLYGVSPQLVLTVGAIAGMVIWIVGVIIIIWHEVGAARSRIKGVKK